MLAASKPVERPYKYLRTYPSGPLYAHVTGYYSAVFGSATGVEAAANAYLNGTADQLFYRRISDLLTGGSPRERRSS